MQYLLDTVAVVRHFSAMGKIGNEARKILSSPENSFIISVISLMEIMYLAEKKRITISLNDTFAQIESSSIYSTIDLTPEILKTADELEPDNNHLVVIVIFKTSVDEYGKYAPNNFVVTGWAKYIQPKR